jgi:hypothetical protein
VSGSLAQANNFRAALVIVPTAKKVFAALTHNFGKSVNLCVFGATRHLFAVNACIYLKIITRVRARLPDTGLPDNRTLCPSSHQPFLSSVTHANFMIAT